MKSHPLFVLLIGVLVAGCDQTSQELPFTVDNVIGRTIESGGGTVSTPSGASVEFPSGSVSRSVKVTVEMIRAPQETQGSGAAISEAYRLEPAGLRLDQPALADLKFSGVSDPGRAWLASVVSVTPGRVVEHRDTRVDLATGHAAARISELATLAVVIPPADAVFPVRRRGAALSRSPLPAPVLAAAGTDSLVVHCGEVGNRCRDLTATASDNLLDRVEEAAVVFPSIHGRLRLDGAGASDSIVLNTTIRARIGSGRIAENIAIHAVIQPTGRTVVTETASEIRLTNVYFRVTGATDTETGQREERSTLVISKGADGATVSITRTLRLRTTDSSTEDATVSVSFPVEIHQ